MAVENFEEKFAKIVSKTPSPLFQKIKWHSDNDKWLKKSQAIAIQIGDCMDTLNMTKEELSEKTNIPLETINNIAKGWEDMTLQTISKLETALNTKLITMEYDFDKLENEKLENEKPTVLDYNFESNDKESITN